MASKAQLGLIAQVLVFNILLVAAGQALGMRAMPGSSGETDVKQPEWLMTMEPRPTVLIPGAGRYFLPPFHNKKKPYNPITGEPITGNPFAGSIPHLGGGSGPQFGGAGGGSSPQVGGAGGGSSGGSHIPGGDDTLMPNPGFEVPTPGGVPAPTQP